MPLVTSKTHGDVPVLQLSFVLLLILAPAATAQTVTGMASGYNHTVTLKSDGSLWAMGQNNFGQLGDGTSQSTNYPEPIVGCGVTAVAAGAFDTLFLTSGGNLWAMGRNYDGELGDGTFINTNAPELVVAGGVQTICPSQGFHTLFVKNDGSLWAMGWNLYGQLGNGTDNNSLPVPQAIVASNVTAIAAGYYHSLFIKTDGSLWAMGNNNSGQLGDGTFQATNRPEQIIASGVAVVAAGKEHSLFLKSDGSLWAMGANNYGQLGDGTTNNANRPEQILPGGVTAIAGGRSYTLFVKADGSLWGMGSDQYGELGASDGPYPLTNRPQQIVTGGVVAIAAADLNSRFLDQNGSLWGMGPNDYGQLGDGTYNTAYQPEEMIAASPVLPPRITSIVLDGPDLILQGTGAIACVPLYLLSTTNTLLPRNQWPRIATNVLTLGGSFTLTLSNAVDLYVPQRYYSLDFQPQ